MSVELRKYANMQAILLDDAVDIGVAAELKAALIDGLEQGQLRVGIGATAQLDTTAMQLLWAAGVEARAAGARLELAGAVPESVNEQFRELGLDPEEIFAAYEIAAPGQDAEAEPVLAAEPEIAAEPALATVTAETEKRSRRKRPAGGR